MHGLFLTAVCLAAFALLQGCGEKPHESTNEVDASMARRYDDLRPLFATTVERHGILTAGVALIENGEVVWTAYFGEQSPSVPASALTQFNVGSVTKTVATETILRLVEAGELDLDEPMAPTWVDPDILDDPRHELLTPRMALTHTTGFPNWRFFTEDGKLKFVTAPGATFSYSGEGFEYLAAFAEKRTGKEFGELVQSYVFDPIGVTNAAYSIEESNYANIAQTRDANGIFPGHYCYPENSYCRSPGSSTPADDLVITVEDYAAFLISVMNSEGYSAHIAADRDTVQSTKSAHPVVDCSHVDRAACPLAQGYGLGWEVLDYGDRRIVSHGGSDWHELALAYFEPDSHDGVVIFLNAPNLAALAAMPDVISILDANSPMIELYRRWYTQAGQSN